MMYLLNKAGIAMIALVVTIVMNTFEIILADKFDLKATLLKHREQHTNHLNKDFAYNHFRRLDQQRIEQLQALITYHERRLIELGSLDEHEHRVLTVARARKAKLLSETVQETQERYAELHDAMQSEHTLGLNDLDFSKTGL